MYLVIILRKKSLSGKIHSVCYTSENMLLEVTLLRFPLWFVLGTLVAFSNARTLCPRIFFQNVNEKYLPYKMIEGVYVKQSYNNNSFPVYKRENGNIYFYRHVTDSGKNFLIFEIDRTVYVAANIFNFVNPSVWIGSGVLNRNDVFTGLLHQWQYLDPRDQLYHVLRNGIKAICVDDSFRECNSDRVYMNDNFTDGNANLLNDMTRDYFSRREGVFRNLRPVYTHSTQPWYLQYLDGYWVVTGNYNPQHPDDNAFMKVKDLALRPEYVSATWSVHYSGWRDSPSLRVMCRGVRSMSNICPSKPCDSRASCVYTSGNETLCVCPAGYSGMRCSVNKQCPMPSPNPLTEFAFVYFGKRPGDLGMTFCKGSTPDVRFALCVGSRSYPYWSRQGMACQVPAPSPTTRPYIPRTSKSTFKTFYSVTRTSKPINFDDNPSVLAAVIPSAILLQILLPFLLLGCAYFIRKCKDSSEHRHEQRRHQEAGVELERRLQTVSRAETKEELAQGVQQYQQTVQEYRNESEGKEQSRKRGWYRNVSLRRLISMHLFFSFYLWVSYVVGCEVTQCTKYGTVLLVLKYMAYVVLVISPLFIFYESFYSHELAYLKNIMVDETAWEYIRRIHAVQPVINMLVECYHYETRTRTVYYTDANGNSQSRLETYLELVVTFTEHEEFPFGSWVDVSEREMPELSSAVLTRIKIDSSIIFGDQETADDYERKVAEMVERNRHRDAFTSYSSSTDIPGLKERISAYVDLKTKPFWIRPLFFWIATLLFMTWPYRWLFRAKSAKTYYTVKKKIYKSVTPPVEVDIMDPIAMLMSNAPSAPSTVYQGGSHPGVGNLAFQNDTAPYPPFNAADLPTYPVTPQPSARPANAEGYDTVPFPNTVTYPIAGSTSQPPAIPGLPIPTVDVSSPVARYATAQPTAVPVLPVNNAIPQNSPFRMDAVPPTYQEVMVHNPAMK